MRKTKNRALQRFKGFRQTYLKSNGSLIELVVFKQPELAETLKAIAAKGATEFYKGEIAQKIVADA